MLKFCDKHSLPIHMGAPPPSPPPSARVSKCLTGSEGVTHHYNLENNKYFHRRDGTDSRGFSSQIATCPIDFANPTPSPLKNPGSTTHLLV